MWNIASFSYVNSKLYLRQSPKRRQELMTRVFWNQGIDEIKSWKKLYIKLNVLGKKIKSRESNHRLQSIQV